MSRSIRISARWRWGGADEGPQVHSRDHSPGRGLIKRSVGKRPSCGRSIAAKRNGGKWAGCSQAASGNRSRRAAVRRSVSRRSIERPVVGRTLVAPPHRLCWRRVYPQPARSRGSGDRCRRLRGSAWFSRAASAPAARHVERAMWQIEPAGPTPVQNPSGPAGFIENVLPAAGLMKLACDGHDIDHSPHSCRHNNRSIVLRYAATRRT